MNLFISNAFAEGAAKAAGHSNPMMQVLPFILIFGIFYFFMIRPQKKKMQEEDAMMNALAKGDEVYTKSGIIGTIHGLTEKIVTLEISEGVKLKVLKGQIGGLSKKIFEQKDNKK